MDLEERIARLISPGLIWDKPNEYRWETFAEEQRWDDWCHQHDGRVQALKAARRVIDGLNLQATEFIGYDYTAINIFGQIPKEDM